MFRRDPGHVNISQLPGHHNYIHDKGSLAQEEVGVLGVEEGDDGVAELGPIAVVRKGEGVNKI